MDTRARKSQQTEAKTLPSVSLLELNSDVLEAILKYLHGINLAVIAQVCTQLRDFVHNFWRDTVALQ